jgi:hypothetical protein
MNVQRLRFRRLLAASVFAVAGTLAPVAAVLSQPPAQNVANCPNGPGVLVGKQVVGAYTTNCDLVVTPPPAIGAAPSAGAIIACRGLPGCLSSVVNNPGWVNVPRVDNTPRSNGH